MSLNIKLQNAIENLGFSIDEETSEYITLQQHTPAGEDWSETFWHYGLNKELANKIYERYNEFDVDEEAEFWVRNRGKNGVPSSIKEILEDQEWKENKLEDLWRELDVILQLNKTII